ncbi:hypothetical protein JXB02_03705 [Candidatus Woesearchaeota archaeon]|nr:hypothetical protein [Candidatus Woesearchaeota archaeon]
MPTIRAETLLIIREAIKLLDRVKENRATKREIISHLERVIRLGVKEAEQEEVIYEDLERAEDDIKRGKDPFSELDDIGKQL